MAGALSILRTTLFLTRTFVLVQRARAISCICLPEEQKWPRDPFITMEVWFFYYHVHISLLLLLLLLAFSVVADLSEVMEHVSWTTSHTTLYLLYQLVKVFNPGGASPSVRINSRGTLTGCRSLLLSNQWGRTSING